jgi:hypothetical protein
MSNEEIKKSLKTAGFPRSGNTFLNFVLKSLYFPTEGMNGTRHEANMFDRYSKLIVPIRNPIDCIASYNNYIPLFAIHGMFIERDLKKDIAYYLRFYNKVMEYRSKAVVVDFDKFTTDIDYIKEVVDNNFGYTTNVSLTINQAKTNMAMENQDFIDNLPRDNKEELDAVKTELQQMPEFAQCMDLYNQLKGL